MSKLQTILDTCYNGLWEQNAVSRDPYDDTCKYRLNGLKCGAGFLIPDNVYNEEFEGSSVYDVDQCDENPVNRFFHKHYKEAEIDLIRRIQRIHDSYEEKQDGAFRQYLNMEFHKLAREFDLEFTSRGE